jgi:adenylate cyclase
MSLISELKRRNVFRAAAAYVAVAWLVMQVAEVTFPAFDLSDRALRLLIIALAIGFIPATVLAWVFELTPEGFKRERDLDRSGPLAARTNRLLDRAIVVLLALGLTYFAIDKFFLSPAREQARIEQALEQGRSESLQAQLSGTSIVVLPCINLSTDPEQAYIADGMAEELLNLLARIHELRVISRTSAFAFKGRNVDITTIAGQLKVSHVLECSVRRSGNRLRIAAQLIDAKTDTQLWSDTYDRALEDIFAIQDEIASRVVDALKLKLLGKVPKSRSVDPQAYMLFMQARQLLNTFNGEDAGKIYALLKRALDVDPGFKHAWTELARVYYRCSNGAYPDSVDPCRRWSREEAWQLSERARHKALSIDPDDAIAIAYGAWLRAFKEKDWAGAAPEFERALALDPTESDVLRTAAQYALYIRRPDVSVRLGEFAVARDPLCTLCLYDLARAYWDAGRLNDAEAAMRSVAATGRGGWNTIALLRLARGDAEGALAAAEKISDTDDPGRRQARAMALYSLGREKESLAELQWLNANTPDSYNTISEVHAWRGEFDQAFAVLLRASDLRNASVWPIDWIRPFLRPLFETARGQELLRHYGVADDQLSVIKFDPRLPTDASGVAVDRS